MESDSKKRGRPPKANVYWKTLFRDLQGRTLTNMYYVGEAQRLLIDAWGNERYLDVFVKQTGKFKYQSVLEQIGRMYDQNGYNEGSCIEIAETALKLLENGYRVKAVADWVRHGRNTNEW